MKRVAHKERKASEISWGGNHRGKGGGGDDNKVEKAKLQKKYQAAVAKAAKKLVASPLEAEKAECAAADLSLEAAIKRRGTVVSATSVVPVDEDTVAEK